MNNNNPYFLGKVYKLHGYKGKVNIFNETDVILDFPNIKYLFIDINSELIPYYIDTISLQKKSIILVKFEDINSENEAKKLLHCKIYIDKSDFKINSQSSKKILGYTVEDKKHGILGKVIEIDTQTPQSLLYIKKNNDYPICIPLHEHFIKKINDEDKIITSLIPLELLEINKNSQKI